eukprot:g5627.t1
MEAIVPNVTLTSSQFVKFKTPVLDISNQDTVVTVNPSSDNALKIADLDGNTFLRMDTDTGQTGKPSDMFIGTTLHVQLPDVPNVGAGAYDVMKIHETELTLSSTNNAMLTSLHVDNMQLKGSQGVSLNMAATLYVDGSAIVPTDESSLSISGFNTSTTNYGLYVAGDTSYNQVRGKLFVKGGLYLGESNGTFTEISSSAFELTTGTDSSSNNVADKVVVTDDQKFVNVKNLNIIGTDSQLQLNSTLVEVGARELNYLKGITRGDYFSTTDDSENNNKVLRIRDYKVNTMPMTIYSWDSSVPDLKLTSRYAEITQEYSSGGRLDISSTNGLVRIEDVKFTGGVIEEVASIAFGGATKDSVYTTLQLENAVPVFSKRKSKIYTNDSVSIDEDTNQPSLGFQLRTATINNKVHEMERLLRKEPSLVNDAAELGEHGAVESGLTSLHIACQLGLDECVGLLVYHKAEVNAQTEGGNTPLHFACSEGHSSCVDQLINAGAKTHLMDILDQTPKDVAKLACKHEWEMCVNLIEEDEVRFGFKVIKIASGIVTFAVAGFLGYWYWSGHNSGNVKKNSTPKNK